MSQGMDRDKSLPSHGIPRNEREMDRGRTAAGHPLVFRPLQARFLTIP